MVVNFLRGIPNPFGLDDPPEWWLQELAKFDDQLVLFPSQKDAVFRLGRKARASRGAKPADYPGVQNHPDTLVMCNHQLVPVTTVMPGAIWTHRVFEKLAERDTWRHGGADKVADILESNEQAQAAAVQREHESHADAIGHDAYASMKYRTGQRVSMAHHGASNNRRTGKQLHFSFANEMSNSAHVPLT